MDWVQETVIAYSKGCPHWAIMGSLLKKPTLDPEQLKNYHQIPNFLFLSKVIERVVAEQLQGFLNEMHCSDSSLVSGLARG